jgi:hypothetical protein
MDLSSHGTVAPVLASGEMYRTISSSPRSLVLSQYYIVLKSWLISSRSRNVVPGRVGGISVEGKPKRLGSRPEQVGDGESVHVSTRKIKKKDRVISKKVASGN